MQLESTSKSESPEARVTALEAVVKELTSERDRLREAYEKVLLELELLRRRLFVAKAERVDSSQLALEFAAKIAELDLLTGQGAGTPDASPDAASASDIPPAEPPSKKTRKPTGRRDLSTVELPDERIEILNPELEGKAIRIGFEESYKLSWRRGGMVRVTVARAKYLTTVNDDGDVVMDTAPLPPETLERSLATPALLAHVASSKFCDGLPLNRLEDILARDGVPLDRGMMCRWLEHLGATLGASIVHAMRADAMANAFCLATDATGIAVQPRDDDASNAPKDKSKNSKKPSKPCKRGHFFVIIADRDHVFFEYLANETSKGVGKMFRGFDGYIQADAKSVYDVLFVPPSERAPPDDGADPDQAERFEVGCWAHARRKFWEAACAKIAVAREALVRIGRFFDRERDWQGKPPSQIKALRQRYTRPELEAFFVWAGAEYEKVKEQRGSLRSAFGYVMRQRGALTRFLEDGRLKLDNNRSERELRRVAVGRKAWLFVGSDEHAETAGHLLSLIASARLHGLDPERYLRDVIRVLPHWPKARHLELAPRNWTETRQRIDTAQLEAELGPLTVPPPATTPEKPASN